jgi:tyrosine decarboxylase/aspartate 1-decarboxylase
MRIIKKMEYDGLSISDVERELNEAYAEDLHFADGRILYSMCNQPPKLAVDTHMKFIESNLGDPNLYPGTRAMERSVIDMLLDILHGKNHVMGGGVVSGGTEANITALWIYRNLHEKRERAQIVLPTTAHYSFEIAADMLQMEMRYVSVDENFRMSLKKLKEAITEKTAVVVAIAGTTAHGQIDPINEIQGICVDKNIPLHVDAAFGGMVFPFLVQAGYSIPSEFDFALDGVSSITVDPHKMGQATLPCGALLVRNPEWYNVIRKKPIYLSAETLTSIIGTRCSASVAAAYAVMRHYGIKGYMTMLQKCMKKTEWLSERIKEMGLRLAISPISPVVCISLDNESTAIEIQKRLLKRRWWVSRTINPYGIRFVMMPHIRENILPSFLADLQTVCTKLQII